MANNQFHELDSIAVFPTSFFLTEDLVKTDKPERALKVQFKMRDITVPASLDAVDVISRYALEEIYDRFKSAPNPELWQADFRNELLRKSQQFNDAPIIYLTDSDGNIIRRVDLNGLSDWPLIDERVKLIISERRSLLLWLSTTEPKNIKSFGTVLKTKLSPHEIWALTVYMSELGLIRFETKGYKAKRSKVEHWLSEHILSNVSKGGTSYTQVDRTISWSKILKGGADAYRKGPHHSQVNSDFSAEIGNQDIDPYDENILLFSDEIKAIAKSFKALMK